MGVYSEARGLLCQSSETLTPWGLVLVRSSFVALAKRYHNEAGTFTVMDLFNRADREIRIASLSLVEFQSVFAGKVRAGCMDRAAAGLQRARLLVDIAAGEVELVAIGPNHFLAAARLLGKYGFTHRLRTLDAHQLAVLLELHSQSLLDIPVTAEKVMLDVAALEGIAVLHPEAPPIVPPIVPLIPLRPTPAHNPQDFVIQPLTTEYSERFAL